MKKWLKKYDIATRLLAALAAVMLWFFVISNTDPPVTYPYENLSFELEGLDKLESAGLTIIGGSDQTVTLKVRDTRDKLRSLRKDQIKLVVDVSSITGPGDYFRSVTPMLSNVNIVSVTPNQVQLTVDRIVKKSIPVQIKITGDQAEGYLYDEYELSPDAVEIEGPEQQLNKVDHALIEYDVTDIKKPTTTKQTYTLVDASGNPVKADRIKLLDASVTMELKVRQAQEVPLTVTIIPTDVITADMVEYQVEPASLLVTGDPNVISTLHQINLGSLNIKKMLEENVTEVTLPIILPNGIEADMGDVTDAKVTISFRGMAKKEFTVPSERFALSGKFTYLDDSLKITLIGDEEVMALVTPSDIWITPVYVQDDLRTGVQTLPVSITVNGRKVAAIGKYTVRVNVPES